MPVCRRAGITSGRCIAVSAWRPCAEALFFTPSGGTVPFSCVVDTGAPFSVLPYSLWHDRSLSWTPRGRRLTRQGGQNLREFLRARCQLDRPEDLTLRQASTLIDTLKAAANVGEP